MLMLYFSMAFFAAPGLNQVPKIIFHDRCLSRLRKSVIFRGWLLCFVVFTRWVVSPKLNPPPGLEITVGELLNPPIIRLYLSSTHLIFLGCVVCVCLRYQSYFYPESKNSVIP